MEFQGDPQRNDKFRTDFEDRVELGLENEKEGEQGRKKRITQIT